ncbi:MAG: hypothetical protein IPL22_01890 [Bacteroidetes bacterium]|nr:hypothetical protein [Bacteroidota bacterium]
MSLKIMVPGTMSEAVTPAGNRNCWFLGFVVACEVVAAIRSRHDSIEIFKFIGGFLFF